MILVLTLAASVSPPIQGSMSRKKLVTPVNSFGVINENHVHTVSRERKS